MKWIQYNWLKVVAIIMLLAAILPIPYFAYYQVMNWIVVGAAIVTALQAHTLKKEVTMWLFLFVAVVFNPIDPLHLRTDVWQLTDLAVALLFTISFLIVKLEEK